MLRVRLLSIHKSHTCKGGTEEPLCASVQTKMDEARWQEQEWFEREIGTKHPECAGIANVGLHYLLWRVQQWLVPQINVSLTALKENMEDG